MNSVFLSPSAREYERFCDKSGTEEYYMNLIADYTCEYLDSAGIPYKRSSRGADAKSAVAQSNADVHGLHLVIQSADSPARESGKTRGVCVIYRTDDEKSKKAAEVFARNFRTIYPNSQNVRFYGDNAYTQLNEAKCPAVLVKVGHRDNISDAEWIRGNLKLIAGNLALSVSEFLTDEQITADNEPPTPENSVVSSEKTVSTGGPLLNMRAEPSFDAPILRVIPNGTRISAVASADGWYRVSYDGADGYVFDKYISSDTDNTTRSG